MTRYRERRTRHHAVLTGTNLELLLERRARLQALVDREVRTTADRERRDADRRDAEVRRPSTDVLASAREVLVNERATADALRSRRAALDGEVERLRVLARLGSADVRSLRRTASQRRAVQARLEDATGRAASLASQLEISRAAFPDPPRRAPVAAGPGRTADHEDPMTRPLRP